MITSSITYLGDLRTEATHKASGKQIITDAPIDNMGKGQAFSPTDLLATSLGNCMLTLMGIAANARNININQTRVDVTKIMAIEPRKVAEVKVEIFFAGDKLSETMQQILKRAALSCPVALSLHPDLKQTIAFNFQ
ncbi:MAG: OsmC family protein [Bacteroidia bacterium]|nr:OsmC family protein [Bacteroidia bacterium]